MREPRTGGPFRAAVFDLDGTLVDSYAAIHESLNHALRLLGRPPKTLFETTRLVGRGLANLLESVVGPGDRDQGVALFRERYADVALEMTTLLPGAEELTAELERRGIPMGVASNKPSDFSVSILEELGLLERFVVVTGPDEGFPPKPDPAMVFHVLSALEAEPGETLYVGDMPVDVKTARAASLAVAVLPTGSSTRAELDAARADHRADNLMQLLPLFANDGI